MSGLKQTLAVCLWLAVGLPLGSSDEVNLLWQYDITTAELFAGDSLPDGDAIRMTEEKDNCIAYDEVEIRINLLNPIVTWWKAFRLHSMSNTNYYRVVVEIQDDQPPLWGRFRQVDMYYNHVVLWKAKTFGTESAIYRIIDASSNLKGGHRYTLFWNRDRWAT